MSFLPFFSLPFPTGTGKPRTRGIGAAHAGFPSRRAREYFEQMAIIGADAANARMIDHWNGEGGRSWLARPPSQERLDAITDALFARAAVEPGERVVDIGCGTGATTIDLLRFVGADGRVLGIDVSGPMLARAREGLGSDPRLTLVQADATTYPFPEQSFDLALSRMGVMFFAEPAKSFANIRRALRRGGRLTFACWRTLDENRWQALPVRAILSVVAAQRPPDPEEPGGFSLGAEARVRRILDQAGFEAVALEPVDTERDLARGGGLDGAVSAAVSAGPAARLLRDKPAEAVSAARAAVRGALAPYLHDGRILLAAAAWIVCARNP
jgi:SAM-dependent methyltransferase